MAGCPRIGGAHGETSVVCRQGANKMNNAAAIAIFCQVGFKNSFQSNAMAGICARSIKPLLFVRLEGERGRFMPCLHADKHHHF